MGALNESSGTYLVAGVPGAHSSEPLKQKYFFHLTFFHLTLFHSFVLDFFFTVSLFFFFHYLTNISKLGSVFFRATEVTGVKLVCHYFDFAVVSIQKEDMTKFMDYLRSGLAF